MIKLEGITKSFGSLQVLKGIDLEINKGEIVSIVGPSGAGKTTLLQIMGTLDEPDAGTVQIDGTVVSRMKEKELSAFRNKNIGFVFQFHYLLPEFSALENVMLPALVRKKADKEIVRKKAEDYLLEVKARNLKSQSINGKLIGYRYVSDGSISQYLDEQKPYKWVRGFWKKQNYTAKENMTYDKVKLKEQMEKLECVKKENQTAPEDAYVAYKDSKFEIVPETEGNTLDFNGAYQALSEAITDKKRTIDLNSCPAVYVKAAVMKDDPDLKNSLEECQNLIRTKIVYIFGEETVTLEGDEIRNWLIFDERGQLQKNEDKLRQCVAEYVAQLAATHDTVNTEREFCTTSGRTVQVYSSVYGWKIDQEKEIETEDSKRYEFHKYYTNEIWGMSNGYELCLDEGILGIDGCVKMILDYLKIRNLI